MKKAPAKRTALDLIRGDEIIFDFRGRDNHLGQVEVWDTGITTVGRETRVKLTLRDAGGRYHYRSVSTFVRFELAS